MATHLAYTTNTLVKIMANIPRPPFLSPLNTTTAISSPKPTTLFVSKPSLLKPIKSNAEPSLPISSDPLQSSSDAETGKIDPVKLAFEKSKAYKKSLEQTRSIIQQNPVQEIGEIGDGNGGSELGEKDSIKLTFEKAEEYKKSLGRDPIVKIDQKQAQEGDGIQNGNGGSGLGGIREELKEVPVSLEIAMKRAKEYKKNKGSVGSSGKEAMPGLKEEIGGKLGSGYVDKRGTKKEEPKISSIDFVGLNFADKKEGRGLPAGLLSVSDPFPEGDLPEVELIVGDAGKFEDAMSSNLITNQEESSELYKPKVSTWGVFPRPGNISKTFGGGRVIRPGEVLETTEDKAAKEARTRQLLAAYKKKMGLNLDPKLKYECEKALKDGDSLMDLGKLKEALPYYEKVMEKLTFQSELHGLAALQWSICQDSLNRLDEARVMYEKLQSHPNVKVSKKARQFIFGFQAMEMMRVTSSSLSSKNTGYQDYFEAFVKKDKANFTLQEAEVEEEMEAEELDAPKGSPNVNSIASSDRRNASFNMGIDADQEQPDICKNPKDRCKRPVTDSKESRNFNPRDPNFLPVEPDPEAEKVDLKHQMMDERKNTEEWMLDYALRQAVTKLAPARKRKVALLVEAFETVLPIPKYEPHLRQTTAAFAHVRTFQACS